MENQTAPMDQTLLTTAMQAGYGFEVAHLEFLQRGWGGDCYRAETHSGACYFLKLHNLGPQGAFAASSRDFYLPLMDQLYNQGILSHIPHPLRTRSGALSLAVGPRELVVSPFIQGELVGYGQMYQEVMAQFADLVGTLHASLPRLSFEHPFIDRFEIAFEPALRKHLVALDAINSRHSPGMQQLQVALLPRREEVYKVLNRLKTLQTRAKAAQPEMVVCHTDLHGNNLMRDAQGNLYLLDWENAMIAPREHDMIFFAGDPPGVWDVFWPVYRRRFPGVELDPYLLSFYFHRRGLEDIADFLVRIAQGDGGPQRDLEDLEELLEILDGLALLEERG